jgi:hypothetical protein
VTWILTTFGPLDDDETELSRQAFQDAHSAMVEYQSLVDLAEEHGGGIKLIRPDGQVVAKFSRRARND